MATSQVSQDLLIKAHGLCSKFLGREYSDISPDELLIRPLKGGLTNDLFVCALPSRMIATEAPRQVVLRLYGTATGDIPLQLKIFSTLASKNLGPKLYGHIDEGRLEEFLPSSPLTAAEMRDPKISAVIAKKIASIQHIDVPIPKTNNWLLTRAREWCDKIKTANLSDILSANDIPSSTRIIIPQLLSIDFETEYEFVRKLMERATSPLVFSNNDLHQNNILIVEPSESKSTLEDRIVLIDFEYSSYNFSAFDVANHFAEWRFDWRDVTEYPNFTANDDRFPTKSEQRNFIRPYLLQYKKEELDSSKKSNNGNGSLLSSLTSGEDLANGEHKRDNQAELTVEEEEVDKFLEELTPLVMASDFLWSVWAVSCAIDAKIKYFYWEIAMAKYSFYSSFKQKYSKILILGNEKSRL